MSFRITEQVWDDETLPPTQRLVLLSLAHHASDEGVCYPSTARLCRRTGLGERAVQGAIRGLVKAGWVSIDPNAGPRGCNIFTIQTPAADAPPQDMPHAPSAVPPAGNAVHPAPNAPALNAPPQQMRQTPAADAPEPVIEQVIGGGGSACADAREADDHEAILIAAGIDPTKDISGKWYGTTQRWIASRWFKDLGLSLDEAIGVLAETRPANVAVGSLAYFDQAMQRLAGQKAAVPLSPTAPAEARASPPPRGLNADQFDAAFNAAFASRK